MPSAPGGLLSVGLLVLAYLFIAPGLTLSFKWMFSTYGFHYPMSVVSYLLMLEWCMALACRWLLGKAAALSNWRASVKVAAPIGVCIAAEVAASNLSLLTLSVSFHTMVKASAPVFVLLFSTLLGLESPDWRTVATVCFIVLGIAVCALGELRFSLAGFLFVLLSTAAAGLRWSLSQLLLQGSKLHTVALLVWTLPAAIVVLPPFAAAFELSRMVNQVLESDNPDLLPQLAVLGFGFAGAAFGLMNVELGLVHHLSSLSFVVLAVGKELLLILLSIVLNEDDLTPLNWLGFAMALVGMVVFKSLRQSSKAEVSTEGSPPATAAAAAAETSETPVWWDESFWRTRTSGGWWDGGAAEHDAAGLPNGAASGETEALRETELASTGAFAARAASLLDASDLDTEGLLSPEQAEAQPLCVSDPPA